jgi:hypothetical protein
MFHILLDDGGTSARTETEKMKLLRSFKNMHSSFQTLPEHVGIIYRNGYCE